MRNRRIGSLCLLLWLCSALHAGQQDQQLDQEFQSAVHDYESGQFAQAAAKLETLLRAGPQNFDVQELAGLVYSAQSLDSQAGIHLQKAVDLNPDSAAARTNLAANLLRLGKPQFAEVQLKKALALEPQSFDINHNLGELYVSAGKIAQAEPFLRKAQQLDPNSYDNGYDLSLADLQTGQLVDARELLHGLLRQKETAELHNLLGEVEEKDGQFIAAAREFQSAARVDPSESNLFDWGSELLLHRTLDPAVEVFQKAVAAYPHSPRLAIGLGMAFYARGNYDDAVAALLKAADLDPADPRCYLFLSRAYDSSPTQADAVLQRFRRFAELRPDNAQAQYYYAMSIWKGKRSQGPDVDLSEVAALLKKSLTLGPAQAEAHLQLGNLYFEHKQYVESIPEFARALDLNSDLADAHYKLGQSYFRTGDKARAQEELAIYQRVREVHLADVEKQRAEIRQFVFSEKNGAAKDAQTDASNPAPASAPPASKP